MNLYRKRMVNALKQLIIDSSIITAMEKQEQNTT